jgi:hypothetical protein
MPNLARAPVAPEPPAIVGFPNPAADAGPAPVEHAQRQNADVMRRFLDAAMRDEEDGWSSDELPDADGFDEGEDSDDEPGAAVPVELMRRMDARERMNRWNNR